MTIQNFETQISATILQRGKQYFANGFVTDMEEVEDNNWSAQVEGSDTYNIEVTLNKKGEIKDSFCDCPYDGDICKHAVAVFFALRDEWKKREKQPKKAIKKDIFESLLLTISARELQDFVRVYASKNKGFKPEFELFFADKDSRIDVEKSYADLIAKLIKKHTQKGFIDYRSSSGLAKDVSKLLETGFSNIAKNNFRDALALAKAVLKPLTEAMTESDDSNGSIGGAIDETVHLLESIAQSSSAAIPIKEQLFNFVQTELGNKLYFDYGDFGYELFSTYQNLAIQLNQADAFFDFIDAQLAKISGVYSNHQVEFYKKSRIEFLQITGKTNEAEKLIQQSLDIVEVRQGEVNKVIGQKDFSAAKKLIEEGIQLSESKNHLGITAQWQKQLLRIAVLEKDTENVRHFAKYFAFDRGFAVEYYQQWKKTFSGAEWNAVIENHISDTIKAATTEWEKDKHRLWDPGTRPPLLEKLAPIYIQENFWERLLVLVQQENGLNPTLAYHKYLYKIYPTELLAIYLPTLERYGINSNGRGDYADLVRKMQRIIKDMPETKEQVLAVAQKLKTMFSTKPRRPAMLEELAKILK